MKISSKSWKSYIERLSRIDQKAANAFADWFREHPDADTEDLLNYAYYTSDYYGNAASELACEMYDEVAVASGKTLPPAEPARTATYGEVAKAVMGRLLTTQDPDAVGSVVGTKVKTVGLDTLLKNSLRDGAEFAWIPSGDTCAFCMMLASNGWRKASKKALKNGHAEHVHNNCNCTYAIRFDEKTEVEGYDPEYYKDLYDKAKGDNWQDKVNSMRRDQYAANNDAINNQKRLAYSKRVAEKYYGTWIEALPTDARDKYSEIIRRGTEKMRHGFSCFGDSLNDRRLTVGASKIVPKKGYFDVAMHGEHDAVCFGTDTKNMSPRLLAEVIRHNPNYKGEKIRLFCCNTGRTSGYPDWDYCFAEELANILGVTVDAPDDLLYIYDNGDWGVGISMKKELTPFQPNQRGRHK